MNRPNRTGLLTAISGTLFLVLFFSLLNLKIEKDNQKSKSVTNFNLKEIKKVKKKIARKKKKVRKKTAKKKFKALKPKLRSAMPGSSYGSDFDLLGLDGADDSLLGGGDNLAMTEKTVDQLPEIEFAEPPEYPKKAREKNIKGHVLLNVLIEKTGRVTQVNLLESNPEGIFETVAINAVKNWEFSPAKYQGKDVNVWVVQKIKFGEEI